MRRIQPPALDHDFNRCAVHAQGVYWQEFLRNAF